MKYNRIFLFLSFLFLAFSAKAQEQLFLQGVCVNEKGRAIENVSVYVQDTLLASVTDENGHFAIRQPEVGLRLRFAHVGYEPTHYTVKQKDLDRQELKIELKTKKYELFEVNVVGNTPKIAFDNPVRSVLDYVIADDGIYLLAYRTRNTSVLHLSFEMDTLHELIVSSSYKYLYKDFYGFVHVINNDGACQLGFTEYADGRKKDMFMYAPIPLDLFYRNFAPIITASDEVVITGRYAFFGLEQYYYCVTPTADTTYLLAHVVDEDRRDDLLYMMRTEGFDRFTKISMVLYPKMHYIYNPVCELDNKFYLFAYTDDETIVYDAVGKELERHPLTFHHFTKWDGTVDDDKRWKKTMINDRAKREFYTVFVNDGLCTLMRIDLATGTAAPVLDLSGYPYAETLRIHDRTLFFLYPTGKNHRRALYQVEID